MNGQEKAIPHKVIIEEKDSEPKVHRHPSKRKAKQHAATERDLADIMGKQGVRVRIELEESKAG